jgi:CRP-like cAMP-binding protein
LVEGDHFGEIGMIFGCKRTATIISRNYNTMATISHQSYLDLMNEIPQYYKVLLRHVYNYEDPMKVFMKSMITKIPYFGPNYLNKHLFHKILYSFELKFYNNNHELLRINDPTESLYLVIDGALEIYTDFEGNEFVIERLMPGSILNHRVIFTDD